MKRPFLFAVALASLILGSGPLAASAAEADYLVVQNARVSLATEGTVKFYALVSRFPLMSPSDSDVVQVTLQIGDVTVADQSMPTSTLDEILATRSRMVFSARSPGRRTRAVIDLRRGTLRVHATGLDTSALTSAQARDVHIEFRAGTMSRVGVASFRASAKRWVTEKRRDSPEPDVGTVPYRRLDLTGYSDEDAPGLVIARTSSEWRTLWHRHAPGTPRPAVDFRTEMVVGVFLGGHTPASICAKVTAVQFDEDGARIDVLQRESDMTGVVGVPQSYAAPALVLAIPRISRPVAVQRTVELVPLSDPFECDD